MNEPAAWMYPDDLERFETSETFAQAYSIQVVSPTHGESVPLYRSPQPAAQYDQQALELCEKCGWKTLIPTEGCLNCERKPTAWVGLDYQEMVELAGGRLTRDERMIACAVEAKLRSKNGY